MGFPDKSVIPQNSSGQSRLWKQIAFVILILVFYVLIRNSLYISKGMLEPDFGLINKAYNFNFAELPITLFCMAIVLAVSAFMWQKMRRSLTYIAVLLIFFTIDLCALRYYITFVEPQRLVVRQIRLETNKLKKPIRVLHISDIQSGEITKYERRVFKRIKELSPDLILNTGDFLQVVPPATFDSEFPKLMELIKSVNPQFGTYAVFGDTERELYHIQPEQLMPLQILSSQSALLDTQYGSIDLYGLSLYQSKNSDWAIRSVDDWLKQSDESAFRILMGHSPDFALEMRDKPLDLCLAGHTHGGQVRLPVYGSLVTDSQVPREWARGFRKIGIPYLNISAGAGSNRYGGLPPMRFNCPTEMTLIELVPLQMSSHQSGIN